MSEKAVRSQCLGDQSPFKYRVRKTYSVFEHLLYKLRTFGSKYVNRTVIHSILLYKLRTARDRPYPEVQEGSRYKQND